MFPLESNNDFCGFVTGNNEIPFNTTTQLVSSRKLTFYDFLIKEEIKFINVCQYYNEKGKKEYKGKFTGWNNLTLQDLIIERDRRNNCENNSKFCRIENSPYVVVDIDIEKDTPEHNKCVNDIIKIYGGGVVFKSFSGKTHIWVKKHPEDKNKSNIIGWKTTPLGNVDIIYTGICELNTNELIDFGTLEHSCFTDYRKDTDLDRNIVVSDEILNSKLSNELIEYLELILNKYYENYNSWFALILAIYKITGDIDIADKYSQKASNYEEGVVEQKINSCKRFQFGEGTIRHYARKSNPEKYNEIVAKYNDFTDVDDITEQDIADLFLKEKGDTIINDTHENNMFILNDKTNIWVETSTKTGTPKGYEIRNLIRNTLLPIYNKKIDKFKGKKDLDDTEKIYNKKWFNFGRKIKSHNSLDSIRKIVCDMIAQNSRDYSLDLTRPNYFPFSCGTAINTDTNEIVKIEPDDYISRTSPHIYKSLTDLEYELLHKEMNPLLEQIEPDEEELKSKLSLLREGATGYKSETLNFFGGSGGNGKGTLMDFFKYTLGDKFYKDAGHSVITEASKELDSNVATLDKLRCYVCSEPPDNKPICCSKTKQLTGENEMSGRDLHQKAKDAKVNISTTSFICQHNLMVKFDEEPTNALYRRYRFTQFNSEFTDIESNVDEANRIFPADSKWKLTSTHEKFLMYFIHRLFFHTPKKPFYTDETIQHSHSVLDGSDQFWTWIEDNIDFLPMIDDEGKKIPKCKCGFISFKDFSQKYRSDNFRLQLSVGQVKNKLKMCKRLKKYICDRNPTTKGNSNTITYCSWKEKKRDYNNTIEY